MGDFIFEVTRLSLDLFERKFGIPYQFKKYDTVFCH
jgi:aminopeptidase N